MPLYIYYCKKCKKGFELIIPLSQADDKISCKYCKKRLKKIVTAPYFTIK